MLSPPNDFEMVGRALQHKVYSRCGNFLIIDSPARIALRVSIFKFMSILTPAAQFMLPILLQV